MKTKQKLELINPATGEKFRELSYHNMEEAESKLTSAGKVQKEWKQTSLSRRIRIVEGAMNYFKEHADAIAKDITLQMGKPIKEARNEVRGMIHRSETLCRLAGDALSDTSLPKLEGFQRFI